jgi:hypothetical protein
VLAGSSARNLRSASKNVAGHDDTMTTPQSGDIAARRDRLAKVSRFIRSTQSLAEKIAELTEDELARLCNERGDMVPGASAADTTNAPAPYRLTMGRVEVSYAADEAPETDRTITFREN